MMKELEWIPVKERLPEVRHAVLCYSPYHKNIWALSLHEDGEWYYYWIPHYEKYNPDFEGPITHWMTLPEPPKERKTAHWVFGNTMGHSWMKCSECCVSQSGQLGCWTYCPNCGAEMKGETEVEID